MDKYFSISYNLSVKMLPGLYFLLSFTYIFKIIRRSYIDEVVYVNSIQNSYTLGSIKTVYASIMLSLTEFEDFNLPF